MIGAETRGTNGARRAILDRNRPAQVVEKGRKDRQPSRVVMLALSDDASKISVATP